MSRISSLFGRRARYPLYCGLATAMTGCVLSAALGLAGSVEAHRQFVEGFATLTGACAGAAGAALGPCRAIGAVDHVLTERLAILLLMQGLCFALVVGGAWLVLSRGHGVLVQRPGRGPVGGMSNPRGGRDEIEQLVGGLEELTARQAGAAAQVRWETHLMVERDRRHTRTFQALHEAARLLSAGDVSELSLLNALALLEGALGARTIALCLDSDARMAVGAASVVCTHGSPALLARLSLERRAGEATARRVAAAGPTDAPALVVSVLRGNVSLGTLVVEFPADAQIEDAALQLAESFACLLGLAVSSVSRSQEERRVALMEERSAIAAELHDSLAQSLAFMKIQVARLQGGLALHEQPQDVTQAATELRSGLSSAYREVRELIAAFRVRMGPGGLVVAVENVIEEFSQRSALDIRFDNRLGECRLQVNEEFHVLQVIREALANSVRHARAQQVRVSAVYSAAHEVEVIVEDDGIGSDTPPRDTAQHYGLSIMRERARSLGGELTVVTRAGNGTRVRLAFAPQRLPVHGAAARLPT